MEIPITPPSGPQPEARNSQLRAVAAELEAGFLAEMLKASGLGATPESIGGGAGEDQFASFLVHEHARALVQSGGIGLTEAIFEALKETNHDQSFD